MPSARVYVGRIPKDTTEREIEKLCKVFGSIRQISVKPGFAFVDFDDIRDADDAIKELDGSKFLGEKIMVEMARGERRTRDYSPRREKKFPPPSRTSNRIVIDNLSTSVSWQDLKDHFRRVGDVTFADAHKEREGRGFVEFAVREDVSVAIKKFDDTEFKGKMIKVAEDTSSEPPRERERERSPRRDDRARDRSPRRDERARDKSPRRDDLDRGRRDSRDDDRRRDSRDDDRRRDRD